MNRICPASVRSLLPTWLVLGSVAISLSFSGNFRARAQDSPPTEAGTGGKAIIILDASGSMWGQIEGKHKIEIAREVISDLMQSLDPELELGLMAYGHRTKGDCNDIELLIPPGKVDRKAFLDRVMGIMPVGKTPLTAAVEQAAEVLKIEENPASVILVSDGIETCDRDPCELARAIRARGVAFKAHIVAFDIDSKDAETIRCLADETGGRFLPAQDAASLRDALEMAVTAAAEPPQPAMPEEKLDPATVKAPDSVPAGSVFAVEWEGPDNAGDYVTIVPKDADDRDYGNHAYTRNGSPLDLTAPIQPGPCEVRYMAGRARKLLGRADILVTPVEATLEAPAEVVAGSRIEVKWTGPDNQGDYLTIVAKGTEEGDYGNYAYTGNSPEGLAELRALETPGEAELRYVTGQKAKTLASRPIRILPAEAIVSGPESAPAGSEVEIRWTGPNNQGDYLTIVEKGADEGAYKDYAYTKNSTDGLARVKAPEDAGNYEIRYVTGQESKTLASAPLIVESVSATVKAPASVVAGGEFAVEWTGPRNQGDYVTIVEKGAEVGKYRDYFYTKNGDSPGQLRAPETAGEHEVRFMTGGGKMLVSTPIMVGAADATLEGPEKAVAGSEVEVSWTGPANARDFLAIVPAGADHRQYRFYTYVKDEPTVKVEAPEMEGAAEIRYVTGKDKKTLASVPLTIEAPTAKLTSVPEKMLAGDKVAIAWEGPDHKRDAICIVPPDAPAKQVNNYIYPSNGPDQEIRAPKDPGEYEIRYVTGRERNILAKQKVTVVAE